MYINCWEHTPLKCMHFFLVFQVLNMGILIKLCSFYTVVAPASAPYSDCVAPENPQIMGNILTQIRPTLNYGLKLGLISP